MLLNRSAKRYRAAWLCCKKETDLLERVQEGQGSSFLEIPWASSAVCFIYLK
jgi:hypothetical protein